MAAAVAAASEDAEEADEVFHRVFFADLPGLAVPRRLGKRELGAHIGGVFPEPIIIVGAIFMRRRSVPVSIPLFVEVEFLKAEFAFRKMVWACRSRRSGGR